MIRIITDSLSDITLERGKELDIDIMCLNVRFGDDDYVCGKELSNEAFYEKLETSPEPPASSAVNPAAFSEIFKRYIDAGDEVVAILFSRGMSATCQNAMLAADELDSDKLHLIDCETGTMGQTLLVETAARLRDDGKNADEIEKAIRKLIPRTRVYFVVDNMEYLKRGGRISKSKALVGSLMRMHPILQLLSDGVKAVGKVKGKKSTNQWMVNKLIECPADPDYPIVVGHANSTERAAQLISQLKDAGIDNEMLSNCIGPIVGTHIGPNSLGVGYIEK